jgi:hypothetical protein
MITMMKIKKLTLFAFIVLISQQTFSQDNKYGIWYSADASIKIVKNLKAEFAGSIRTDENASNIESFYLEGGLKYKLCKYISAGAYYRLIDREENDNKFYFRHRLYADVKGTLPLGRFTLSARYRFQEQTKTYIKHAEDDEPGYYNRFKFELDYNVPRIPLTPYVFTEYSGQTFASNDILIEKKRVGGGLSYNITKKQAISAEYIYLSSRVTNPRYFNVLSLNYSVNF